ncbi:hypothetical protein BRYFOR_06689 [Marvinbryantia formatexigens DSM 14469]|uniref:Uncharacterized protein n=1 Tax=Marvinbryantia formatexigens DSM 14469 TaxID=478749 RepID=C6LD31_9FIRM|nr:hypothetical protein BRYFOR_06689 [Marvinbryantia formatexigens DSM 14469]
MRRKATVHADRRRIRTGSAPVTVYTVLTPLLCHTNYTKMIATFSGRCYTDEVEGSRWPQTLAATQSRGCGSEA